VGAWVWGEEVVPGFVLVWWEGRWGSFLLWVGVWEEVGRISDLFNIGDVRVSIIWPVLVPASDEGVCNWVRGEERRLGEETIIIMGLSCVSLAEGEQESVVQGFVSIAGRLMNGDTTPNPASSATEIHWQFIIFSA